MAVVVMGVAHAERPPDFISHNQGAGAFQTIPPGSGIGT
jgi:hypothetical protein